MSLEEMAAKLVKLEERVRALENQCGEDLGIQVSHVRDSVNTLENRVEDLERRMDE